MKKKIMLIVPMLHQGGFERICALTAKLLKDRQDVYLVIFSAEDMIYDVTGVNLINLDLGAVPGKIGKVINLQKRICRLPISPCQSVYHSIPFRRLLMWSMCTKIRQNPRRISSTFFYTSPCFRN